MYIIVAMVMLLRGFADAIMMRSQQALASAGEAGFLPPHHYDQIFTAHGVIMIFFMAMPFVVGLMNVVVPLQIGARDVAFPFLNSLSFWFFVVGVVLINISLGSVSSLRPVGWRIRRCRVKSTVLASGSITGSESADFRSGYPADRRELLRHHSEDACPWHAYDEDAGVHLGGPVY